MQDTAIATPVLELLDEQPLRNSALADAPITALAVPQNSPAAMMLAARAQGFSLEQVGQMMDLQERWEKREAEKAFREDFAAFRGENVIIPKSLYVDRGKAGSFMQAEFSEVCDRLSPALSRHGFGFRHDQKFGLKRRMVEGIENDYDWVWVTCYLEHRKGHAETLELEGPPGELTANTPVQNMQTTASYLKRQALLAITGTATGGEDDEAKQRKTNDGATDDAAHSDGDAGLRTATIADGTTAADKGMKALTAWWGALTPKQRSDLNKEFGVMRRTAAQVDAGAGRA